MALKFFCNAGLFYLNAAVNVQYVSEMIAIHLAYRGWKFGQ